MKKVILALLFFIGFPALAGNDALRHELEKRYALMKEAMEKRDSAAVTALCTADFIETDVNGGSSNLYEMTVRLARLPQDKNKVSKTVLGNISLTGDTATVEQHYEMDSVKPEDGSIKIKLLTESLDTWKNVDGAWLMKRTETRKMDYFLNDKLVAHKVSPE